MCTSEYLSKQLGKTPGWWNDECPALAKPKCSLFDFWGPAPKLTTEKSLRNSKLQQTEDKKEIRRALNGSVRLLYHQRLKGIIKEDLGSTRKDNVVFSTSVLNWRTWWEDSYPWPNLFY